MTVSVVGGGGVRSCVLRIVGPASGMTSVSSPPVCVFGGAFAAGGGLPSAGGNWTSRWAKRWVGRRKTRRREKAAVPNLTPALTPNPTVTDGEAEGLRVRARVRVRLRNALMAV